MASTLCGVCSRRSKESTAIKFCSDCEDSLCTECADVHCAIKGFASHHIVDLTLAAEQAFKVDKICTQHTGMILELYCSDHDTLCCRSCMTEHHRTCEKLIHVDIAATDVKQSTMFEDITASIGNLNKTADELQNQKEMLSTTLKNSKDVVLKKVSEMKVKLLQQIAQLETQTLSEVESVFASLSDKTENNKKNIADRVKAIKEIASRFEFVANHGSKCQIFYLLHSIKLNIHETGKSIDDLIPSLTRNEIVFNESDLLSVMKTFGSINVTEKPCDIQDKPSKNQQAQILQDSRTINKFELEKTISVPHNGCWLTGIAVTKANQLILCTWATKNLIILTDVGQHIKNLALFSAPWGIAVVQDTDEAWVTLPNSSYIQIISTVAYSQIRLVAVPTGCFGITMAGPNVALGGNNGKVYIISKQGERIKELNTGSTGSVHSVCVGGTDRYFCCAADQEKFVCIKLDGTLEFSYNSKELSGPIAVTTDAQRNVYVIGYKSNNLHRFSTEGKFQEIMLTQTVGLNAPYTFAFNRNYSKMFIPNYADTMLRIFSCI